MSAILIDGKKVSAELRADIKAQVAALGASVGLAVVLVGEDVGSQVYVKNKVKACEELGIQSFQYYLDASTGEAQILELVGVLNSDPRVNGILVQLPLPKHIDEARVLRSIAPEKDVDGFHAVNMGRLVIGEPALRPCTPSGIMRLIDSTGYCLEGKRAVVVGRSNIVGKPIALMLLERNATVTVAHSRTHDLPALCREADVLVVAIGRARMITADYIKPGALVIDVGMNRLEKLCGDVDFDSAVAVAGFLTPVPGGVGPMTITMLMQNTVDAAKAQKS